MSRNITVNETDANLRRVYFDLRMIDSITPALGLTGQPQISINGGSFSSTGISVLTEIGFGKYYATLDSSLITTVNTTILPIFGTSFSEEVIVVSANSYLDTNALTSPNAYIQIEDAEDYFATRLTSEIWDNSTPKNKLKSLIEATRLIERLNFFGNKTSASQVLEFPRNNATLVPQEIKFATCEIAIVLLDGFDIELELSNLSINESIFSNVASRNDPQVVDESLRSGIPSKKAWLYLKPFLNDPLSINLARV